MESTRIAELLRPFLGEGELSASLLEQLRLYLDLLLRWNARTNLTAVRDPEQIVTRHFGESLFTARFILGEQRGSSGTPAASLADVGSGAGFPGIPVKLWAPHVHLTLIESQNRKATFLREAIRALKLDEAQVFGGRAEQWDRTAQSVTLRAVEKFERVLPVAASLVSPGGTLFLLIGSSQVETARTLLGPQWSWASPVAIPRSGGRVVSSARRV